VEVSRYALAIDVGGTKVESALITTEGAVVERSRVRQPTGSETEPLAFEAALRAILPHSLSLLPSGGTLAGVGIGSAGPVALEEGVVHPLNMRRLAGFRIVDVVREVVGPTAVTLRLDGSCIALAEATWGATAGTPNSMALVVSTGVGGGIVLGGTLVPGDSGNAGHLGQTWVTSDGRAETLEDVASGPASVRWARAHGWAGTTGEQLSDHFAAGVPIAREAVHRSARALGQAIANAVTLLDIPVVAVGGGFARVTADYVDLTQASARDHALHEYAREVRVVRTGLSDTGPLVGAGALALMPDRVR
jgi:glucokinase